MSLKKDSGKWDIFSPDVTKCWADASLSGTKQLEELSAFSHDVNSRTRLRSPMSALTPSAEHFCHADRVLLTWLTYDDAQITLRRGEKVHFTAGGLTLPPVVSLKSFSFQKHSQHPSSISFSQGGFLWGWKSSSAVCGLRAFKLCVSPPLL